MRVDHVVVAVPVRDEELLLGRCLDSVVGAVAALHEARPGLATTVVLALDRCVDRSAEVAARPGVVLVEADLGSVGRARSVAVARGLAAVAATGAPTAATWVANTDADCAVPQDWLVQHVHLAEAGADLVVGTVVPDHVADPRVLRAWRARHELREGHRHVHGANLGVRATAYLEVGGFAPLPVHEDVALVEAVRAGGRPWVATDRGRVRTSARATSRVEGGFAAFLADLASAPGPLTRADPSPLAVAADGRLGFARPEGG